VKKGIALPIDNVIERQVRVRKLKSAEELRRVGRERQRRWRAMNLERARAVGREWKRRKRSEERLAMAGNTQTADGASANPRAKPKRKGRSLP
jgi:hypothetical protein